MKALLCHNYFVYDTGAAPIARLELGLYVSLSGVHHNPEFRDCRFGALDKSLIYGVGNKIYVDFPYKLVRG